MPNVEFGSPTVNGNINVQAGYPAPLSHQTPTVKYQAWTSVSFVIDTPSVGKLISPTTGKKFFITRLRFVNQQATGFANKRNVAAVMYFGRNGVSDYFFDIANVNMNATDGTIISPDVVFDTPLELKSSRTDYINIFLVNRDATTTMTIHAIAYGWEETE